MTQHSADECPKEESDRGISISSDDRVCQFALEFELGPTRPERDKRNAIGTHLLHHLAV